MKVLLRWVINALALLVLTQVVPGFAIDTFYHALIAALVLGLLNAIVRPVLIVLTLPINIVSLGLFTFVINAGLIWFMSTFIKGVEVTNFWSAILVAIVLWAVATVTNFFLKQAKESK
jgi:putative membrane protein